MIKFAKSKTEEMTKETYLEILGNVREKIAGTEFEGNVFAVGGCVRDEMMGKPIKDIDIVVSLPEGGIRFAEYMRESGFVTGSVVTYETYGTAMFRLAEYPDVEIECVQTRKEQYRDKGSRNPETAYGTLEEDCMRRDLSINALYRNVTSGEILDPCGKGIDDIRDKIIRVTSTPEIVYNDDPLRILRAVRFRCRFGSDWIIDRETYDGMIANAGRLEIITDERKQEEFSKILLTDACVEGVRIIRRIGAMKHIIPELEQTYDMTQNNYHFGTVWDHTVRVLENIDAGQAESEHDLLVLRMSALLHDIGKIVTRSADVNGNVHFYKHELEGVPLIEKILKRLKYPNHFIGEVTFLAKNHMLTKSWKDDLSGFKNTQRRNRAVRKLQYKCGKKRFFMLLNLIHADNVSHAEEHCMPNQTGNICSVSEMLERDGTGMFGFKLPVNGEDVMEAKNLKPGPHVKKYLDYLLKECYNNPRLTKEELIKSIENVNF